MGIDISKLKTKTESKRKSRNSFLFDFLKRDIHFFERMSSKQREFLYKDLFTLLNANVDFRSALDILAKQQRKKYIYELIMGIKKQVMNGQSFHEALKKSGQFSPYEYYSIKIGEETKKLPLVLFELYKYFGRQVRLRKQIISVITYPAFVFVLTIGVLYFMLNYVVPMFKSVFNQFDADLPSLTKNIISLSESFPKILTVFFISVLVVFFLFKMYGSNDKFRAYKAKYLLKIPYFGKLIRMIYLARFCQFMDLLLTSKTSLTESLDLVKLMIGFYPVESSIDTIKNNVVKGSSLSSAMSKFSIYETKMISMIEVSEEINELDKMFSRLGDEYEEEVEHRTKMIGVVMEPMIIIFIGFIVGIIMVAMYAPMFDLSRIINGG